MAKLTYVTNMSLNGFIEDARGAFAWLPLDEEVFARHTEIVRSAGGLVYGRRLYEAMAVWETDPALAAQSAPFAAFARAWSAPAKTVYSRTLADAPTARTVIEPRFDPAALRRLKDAADADLLIGGADIAAQAFAAGLIDECRLFIQPVSVGGGKPGLPVGARLDLQLAQQERFPGGVVELRYRVRS